MKRNREDKTVETIDLDDLTEEPNSKKLIQNSSHSDSSSTYYEQGCGYFDNEDYIKAMELFVKGSEERCSECKYKIGYIYDCGLGVEQDYSKAMEWYLKAAENDHVEAQFNIGILYDNGSGISQDYSKAMEWYLKAAKNGYADAQFNIGAMYHSGQGVSRDYSKAMDWYLKAATKDNVEAQFNIGVLYDGGLGVEQDYLKAMEWYLKAATNNSVAAHFNIALLYECGLGIEQDYSKAMEWYLKAAENDHADSQFNIGILYDNGSGVSQDYSKAMEWYLKAAENDHADAQFNIALLYRNGQGVSQDYLKAVEWYTKAANNGCRKSINNIVHLYSKGGNGLEKDMKKVIFWMAKYFNKINFEFIEAPYEQFAIDDFTLRDEMVVVRFVERDFEVSSKHLKTSRYLSTMMSATSKKLNEQDGNQGIIDLRSVQNDIFKEPTDHIKIFESYLNYLTTNTLSTIDTDTKFKLIELSHYLGDDECILRIVKESTLLMRFYILLKMERLKPLHVAIASCFVTGSAFTISDLSENIVELLLNQTEITSKAKHKMVEAFTMKFKKYPNNTYFGNKILHITLSKIGNKREFNFNNQDVTFTLESCEDRKYLKINSSHNLEFFGKNVKLYIHLTTKNEENIGFWLEKCEETSKRIFKIPKLDEISESLISLIVVTTD